RGFDLARRQPRERDEEHGTSRQPGVSAVQVHGESARPAAVLPRKRYGIAPAAERERPARLYRCGLSSDREPVDAYAFGDDSSANGERGKSSRDRTAEQG